MDQNSTKIQPKPNQKFNQNPTKNSTKNQANFDQIRVNLK